VNTTTLYGAALLAMGPMLVGCASNQALRASLNERDSEISELADENHHLMEELAQVRHERDGLHSALSDASARLADQAPTVTEGSMRYDDLEAAGIGTSRRGDAIVFTVPSAVTFGSGKADLTPSGRKALGTLAARLRSDFPDSAIFHVEGHTDSDPIRKSSFETNRDLSWARARAVHEFLVQECMIKDERFVVVGHGPHRALVDNSTKENKARNRRVEVLVRAGG
jgi:flagellar motor protein MotB